MEQKAIDELRATFEIQIKYQFYSKPEFKFLPSMGITSAVFPIKSDDVDFGILILEWCTEENQKDYWKSTWVDTQEQLQSYKYHRTNDILIPEKVGILFAKRMAEAHQKQIEAQRRQQQIEQEEDWRGVGNTIKADSKPVLN